MAESVTGARLTKVGFRRDIRWFLSALVGFLSVLILSLLLLLQSFAQRYEEAQRSEWKAVSKSVTQAISTRMVTGDDLEGRATKFGVTTLYFDAEVLRREKRLTASSARRTSILTAILQARPGRGAHRDAASRIRRRGRPQRPHRDTASSTGSIIKIWVIVRWAEGLRVRKVIMDTVKLES